jgi:enoyl-[acyl-carrier protein] reductase II
MSIEKLTKLLKIQYPIIQAGMVWVSGGKLAAASANAGCLGTIGAGSMKPELLKLHIQKAQSLTKGSLAVNVPLLYDGALKQIQTALDLGIKIFITSAGSPKKFTKMLKDVGCVVIHVTASPELAKKCEAAGVDAVIAEGFEAGGHNGRDEITTMSLIPQVVDAVGIPVIAAGGIMDARGIYACISLGASAAQMGSRFLMTQESSAHENYKQALLGAHSGSTRLAMKNLVPVRLFENDFAKDVEKLDSAGASKEELAKLLGKGRAKAGMLDGDVSQGELEIGQAISLAHDIPSVNDLVQKLVNDYSKIAASIPSSL